MPVLPRRAGTPFLFELADVLESNADAIFFFAGVGRLAAVPGSGGSPVDALAASFEWDLIADGAGEPCTTPHAPVSERLFFPRTGAGGWFASWSSLGVRTGFLPPLVTRGRVAACRHAARPRCTDCSFVATTWRSFSWRRVTRPRCAAWIRLTAARCSAASTRAFRPRWRAWIRAAILFSWCKSSVRAVASPLAWRPVASLCECTLGPPTCPCALMLGEAPSIHSGSGASSRLAVACLRRDSILALAARLRSRVWIRVAAIWASLRFRAARRATRPRCRLWMRAAAADCSSGSPVCGGREIEAFGVAPGDSFKGREGKRFAPGSGGLIARRTGESEGDPCNAPKAPISERFFSPRTGTARPMGGAASGAASGSARGYASSSSSTPAPSGSGSTVFPPVAECWAVILRHRRKM